MYTQPNHISYFIQDENGEDILMPEFRNESARFFSFWSLERPYVDGRLRYHLGQIFMLKTLKNLTNKGYNTYAVICDPEALIHARQRLESIHEDKETIRRFLNSQLGPGQRVFALSELIAREREISEEEFNNINRNILNSLNNFRMSIPPNQLNENARKDIQIFRESRDVGIPPSLKPLYNQSRRNIDIPDKNLKSVIYAYKTRNTWFELGGISDAATYLIRENTRRLETPMVVLEGWRNAYAWQMPQGAYRHAFTDYKNNNQWPVMGLLRNFPASSGDCYMGINNKGSCIFLDSTDDELVSKLESIKPEVREEMDFLLFEAPALSAQESNERLIEYLHGLQDKCGFLLKKAKGSGLTTSGQTVLKKSKESNISGMMGRDQKLIPFLLLFILLSIFFTSLFVSSSFLTKEFGFLNILLSFLIAFAAFITIGSLALIVLKIISPNKWNNFIDTALDVVKSFKKSSKFQRKGNNNE